MKIEFYNVVLAGNIIMNDLHHYVMQFKQYEKPEKEVSGFSGLWTHDLAAVLL